MEVSMVRGRRFVGGMGSGRGGATGVLSVVCCSHRAQGGFCVKPANGSGSLARRRLGLVGVADLVGLPWRGLGQRWGSITHSHSSARITS
jgi:hypothetical protein